MSLLGTGPRAEFPHRFLIGKMSLRTFVSAVDASAIEFCCRALLLYSQNVGWGKGLAPAPAERQDAPGQVLPPHLLRVSHLFREGLNQTSLQQR